MLKLLRPFAALLACAATLLPSTASAADTKGDRVATVHVGAKTLTLPVLDGFASPQDTSPKVLKLLQKAMPPGNELVAMVMSAEFLAHAQARQSTDNDRYYLVQVIRSTADKPITPAYFEQIKTVFRTQAAEIFKKAEGQVQQGMDRFANAAGEVSGDKSLEVHNGATTVLGVFDERPNSISLATVGSITASDASGKSQNSLVNCVGIVNVNGTVVSMAVYAPSVPASSIAWAKSATTALVTRLATLNGVN